MSIIVTTVNPQTGAISMVADSQATYGDTQCVFSKIIDTPLGMVIGGVGYAETLALLRLFAETNCPRGVSDYDIYKYYLDFKKWGTDNDEDFTTEDSVFHLAYMGHAFSVERGLVQKITDYDAIGSGSPYALAALHLGHNAREAVEVACALNIFCSGPIHEIEMFTEDPDDTPDEDPDTWTESPPNSTTSSSSSDDDSSTEPTPTDFSGTAALKVKAAGNLQWKTFRVRKDAPVLPAPTSRAVRSPTRTSTHTSSAPRR